MTSATRPAASPGPFSRRRRPLRRALWAATLAGCCGTVGCQGTGGPLALLKRGDATPGTAVAEDPFNAAEAALASASGPARPGTEGRVSLGGGGVVRTASLDGARTAARPASEVTRVDPNKPPQSAAGRWKAGEGTDAGAAKVTLAGGAFAASDAPAAARVTPASAQQTAPARRTAEAPAKAPATPARQEAAAPAENADIDWGAEMAAFAKKAAETAEKLEAAKEAATPADSPVTPEPPVAKESAGVTKPAATVTENLGDPLDRESLPHAPLWSASAESEPSEPAAAPAKPPQPVAPAKSAAAPVSEDDGWRSRTADEPAPAAAAGKTEAAAAIDPFAGL